MIDVQFLKDQIKDLLTKLGMNSSGGTLGVSISPNIGIEMIDVDSFTGRANKYSCRPLEYNNSVREIADYELFRIALEELLADLNVTGGTNLVITLPSVHLGLITLPDLLTEEAITNAIISEVEQSYVFKRQEPMVSWANITPKDYSANNDKLFVYSAIQKSAVDQIIEICEELNCKVTCIENSFTTLFRALSYLHLTDNQMKDGVAWNLMVVMQNSYSIISMNGKRPMEYYEEPLALKSFIDDEIYNAIKTSAQMTLAGFPANFLYVVSETDLVSAEVLSLKMPFEGNIGFLECNKFSQTEIIPTSLEILPNKVHLITAEAIGAGVHQFHRFPMKLNFLQKSSKDVEEDNLSGNDIDEIEEGDNKFPPRLLKKIALLIFILIVIPVFAAKLVLNNVVTPKKTTQLAGYEQNITTYTGYINQLKELNQHTTFDVYSAIDNIVYTNRLKCVIYSALGLSVPDKLWLVFFGINGSGRSFVKGASGSTEQVYDFYKNFKQLVNNSSLKLRKLELFSDSIDDVVMGTPTGKGYIFEVTDMSDPEIESIMSNELPNSDGDKTAGMSGEGQPITDEASGDSSANKSLFEMVDNKFQSMSKPQNPDQPSSPEQLGQPGQPGPPGQPGSFGSNPNLPPNLKRIEKF